MNTSFSTLELDKLRYSQVWEDCRIIEHILNVEEDDHVLVITSGGTNVFNTLLYNPKKIFAVDLNNTQNEFLNLQKFIISHFSLDQYLACMGYKGKAQFKLEHANIKQLASLEQWHRWEPFFNASSDGLSLAGKLETYITSFYKSLSTPLKEALLELFKANNIEEQVRQLDRLLETDFETIFIQFFDRVNLSKGRDHHLYKHTSTTGGSVFFQRLISFAKHHLLRDNFIGNFFFFGPHGATRPVYPMFCTPENYALVKQRLEKIETVNMEAMDFLVSKEGEEVNKAVLSNIFEYVSKEEFAQVVSSLNNRENRLHLIFWNLLNNQGASSHFDQFQRPETNQKAKDLESCFYFGTIRHFTV